MKTKSMIFKLVCLALAIAFGFSVMTAFAEEVAEVEDVVVDEVLHEPSLLREDGKHPSEATSSSKWKRC